MTCWAVPATSASGTRTDNTGSSCCQAVKPHTFLSQTAVSFARVLVQQSVDLISCTSHSPLPVATPHPSTSLITPFLLHSGPPRRPPPPVPHPLPPAATFTHWRSAAMLSLVATKAVVLVLMLLLTLAMGLLPLYVYKVLARRLNQVALSISLCFGAGVLLSIVFLHLLPETQENFHYAMEEGFIQHTSYPVAEVSVCSGFFLVYLMEEVIHGWVAHQKGIQDPQVTQRGTCDRGGSAEGGESKEKIEQDV
ncbi:hypothetical protein O3P69_001862 [Scylla paramamosain]|uniref:Uncharacterized protein n=1 Tax=Scylla paramamosain TaxID=85552 RepID=A0AAW0V0H6_SCYPA